MIDAGADHHTERWRLALTPLAIVLGAGALVLYLRVTPGRLNDPYILTRGFLVDRLIAHIRLTLAAFAIATAIALPLGVWLSGRGRVARLPAFLIANLGQAVPGVGVLAITAIQFGLGFRSTLVALVLYGLLPILRNTVTGCTGVDAGAIDAARGMGMTPSQVLFQVRLPLASPLIFAGLRTSLVLIVGTATLGNFIGGSGLGDVIAAGLGYLSSHIIITGAVMVAILALLLDWLLGLVERIVVPSTSAAR